MISELFTDGKIEERNNELEKQSAEHILLESPQIFKYNLANQLT